MELKLEQWRALDTLAELLIEPLWNWNIGGACLECADGWLLIEPLWNWNKCSMSSVTTSYPPFNRTTMELKLCVVCGRDTRRATFNRTTMELKPRIAPCGDLPFRGLLIEPLWNWNTYSFALRKLIGVLLIEPLWNWNTGCQRKPKPMVSLLIEPLWNWNKSASKPVAAARGWLLIEPLWNWNTRIGYILVTIFLPFNRTTMELKLFCQLHCSLEAHILLIEPLWNWNARQNQCQNLPVVF